MAQFPPEERPTGFAKTTPGPLDSYQGPYDTLQQAQNTVPDYLKPGYTIQLKTGTSYDEYWWKTGITQADLVLKNQGGGGGTVSDATTTTKGKLQLAGDLAGTADAPTVPKLADKIDRAKLVAGTNVTIDYNSTTGVSTVNAAGGTTADATSVVKGKLRLAGDLGGTADVPTVPSLANKIDRTKILGGTNTSVVQNPDGSVTINSSGGTGTVNDATTVDKGKLRLAGDLSGTADLPTVPGLAAKLDRAKLVAGSNVSINYDSGTGNVSVAADIADATGAVKGKIKIAGDLGGTADVPTVPGLANKIDRAKILEGTNIKLAYNAGTGELTINNVLTLTVTQTAHGFAVGNILKKTASTYAKALADSEGNAGVVGIVSSVPDANTFVLTVMIGSIVTLSGLTAGASYYLSETTAGAYTTTKPSVNGQVQKELFIALSTTQAMWLNHGGIVVGTVSSGGTGGTGGGGVTDTNSLSYTQAEYTSAVTTEEAAFTQSEYTAAITTEEATYTQSEYSALP